ncbi:methyltransferase [Sulfurifustis variabilis]|uniref:Methyltransferase n=2 Tax=Sulfurifustis variabilis TaxID=1675686 RepID=A0A1B4V3C3_9GAMM|nr:methyltransferase [Sulfurifustis variabilis]
MREALALVPQQVEWRNHLGSLLELGEDLAAAENCYRQVLAYQPNHPAARYNLGNVLNKRNLYPEALENLLKSFETFPNDPRVNLALGIALKAVGRLTEAICALRHAVALSPRYADAHNLLGFALQAVGDRRSAIACYEVALRMDPNHSDAANNLAVMLLAEGKRDQAVVHAQRAVQLRPEKAGYYCTLGVVCHALGERQKAIDAYRTALQLNPRLTEPRFFLAAYGEEEAPKRAPADYVRNLFDDYADIFDKTLVDRLGYRIPELLGTAVRRAVGNAATPLDVIDLGCGTGLCGKVLRGIARYLVGVDLSPKMINKARELNVYDELLIGDLLEPISISVRSYDLIVSADVFVYIGDLSRVFSACRRTLRSGGLLAFSTETDESADRFVLRSTGRYAHAPAYINQLAEEHELEFVVRESVVVRTEAGTPVAGELVVLRRQ